MKLPPQGPQETSWSPSSYGGTGGAALLNLTPAVIVLNLHAPAHGLESGTVVVVGDAICVYSQENATPPPGIDRMSQKRTHALARTIARAMNTHTRSFDITDRVVDQFLYERGANTLQIAPIETGDCEYIPNIDFVQLAKFGMDRGAAKPATDGFVSIFQQQAANEAQVEKDVATLRQNGSVLGAFVLPRQTVYQYIKSSEIDLTTDEERAMIVTLEVEKKAMIAAIKALIAQYWRSGRLEYSADPAVHEVEGEKRPRFESKDGTALHTLILGLQESNSVLFDAIVSRDRVLQMLVDQGAAPSERNLFLIEGEIREICARFERGSIQKLVSLIENQFILSRRA